MRDMPEWKNRVVALRRTLHSDTYAQFPVMGSCRLRGIARHWQIHSNAWFVSLNNLSVQHSAKPWNGEPMMGMGSVVQNTV
jgi:hypothetical protein